jgi:hypothetical protein
MNQSQLHAYQAAMFFILPLVFLIIMILVVIPYWFIWKKAGFSPWLSLLMFVPAVNFIMLYVLAFSEWKVVAIQQVVPQYPNPYPFSTQPPQL